MNVKQWIAEPVTPLFVDRDLRKHVDFRGGFEPIPDAVMFLPKIAGDWRRRNNVATLRHMLLAIETKASKRKEGPPGKISAVTSRSLPPIATRSGILAEIFAPVLIVIDTAPDGAERMREPVIDIAFDRGRSVELDVIYVDPDRLLWNSEH